MLNSIFSAVLTLSNSIVHCLYLGLYCYYGTQNAAICHVSCIKATWNITEKLFLKSGNCMCALKIYRRQEHKNDQIRHLSKITSDIPGYTACISVSGQSSMRFKRETTIFRINFMKTSFFINYNTLELCLMHFFIIKSAQFN